MGSLISSDTQAAQGIFICSICVRFLPPYTQHKMLHKLIVLVALVALVSAQTYDHGTHHHHHHHHCHHEHANRYAWRRDAMRHDEQRWLAEGEERDERRRKVLQIFPNASTVRAFYSSILLPPPHTTTTSTTTPLMRVILTMTTM